MSSVNVKAWRRRIGWSQARLAQALGVHPMTVSKWERGEVQPAPYLALALERLTQLKGEHEQES